MTTPRSLLLASAVDADMREAALAAYRAEMAEAELKAARAVVDAVVQGIAETYPDVVQRNLLLDWTRREYGETWLRAVIEKARREE